MQYIPKAYLTYALDKDGNLVHIDSVPNGNNCGCFCPHCKEELCARNNGEKRIHHFSHTSGADCAGAIESALHIMAKEILQEIKCVQLPNVIVNYIIKNEDTADSQRYDIEEPGELLKFDRIDVECADTETNLRPDCIGYYGNKKIWIEFKQTHAVDEEKKAKIIANQIDCIEIDIKSCELDYDAVRKFIKEDKTSRVWINNTSNNEMQIIKVNDRNYVKNENGNIVNIQKDNVDTDKHSYYCLGCGKKLLLEKKGLELLGQLMFVHDNEREKCNFEQYLRETAKEIIIDKFNNSEKFEISLPQNQYCDERSKCQFYSEYDCYTTNNFEYDLKSNGYIKCQKNETITADVNNNGDLIIKQNDARNDIYINFCTDVATFEKQIENVKSKIIKILIYNDNYLDLLRHYPLGNNYSKFINFKFSSKNTISSSKIEGRILKKFSLFPSGKYYHYPDSFSCSSHFILEVSKPISKIFERKYNAIYEIIFVNEIDNNSAREIFLYKCYKRKLQACYCELCIFRGFIFKYYDDENPELICKRYKTKGTPQYPLTQKPINCPYFKLDWNLTSKLDKASVKIIEKFFLKK